MTARKRARAARTAQASSTFWCLFAYCPQCKVHTLHYLVDVNVEETHDDTGGDATPIYTKTARGQCTSCNDIHHAGHHVPPVIVTRSYR